MMSIDFSKDRIFILILCAALVGSFFLPNWIRFIIQVSLAGGLVALGVMLQMRAGLVSFGQGLFYCIGGYSAGMAATFWGISDIIILLVFGALLSALFAFLLGFLMSRYREIFFAMLSLALSMILYGILVKAEVLGSTDGFNLPAISILGWALEGDAKHDATYIISAIVTLACCLAMMGYLSTSGGISGEALRENELRLEYLGASAQRIVHIKYLVAATISGIGGVLAAISIGHVDPEMAYWTTSGQFVFVALLSGTGSVIAPIVGMFLLELTRIYAVEISPNTWQIILGSIMLLIIIFLPKGLWSLIPNTLWGEKRS